MSLLTANAAAVNDRVGITIYAGPQSVTPEQSIHVTIEANDVYGYSLDNLAIELSYIADGRPQIMMAKTRNGLVSFDVLAQQTAGLMTFSAKSGAYTSTNAVVIVRAGQPEILQLTVMPNKISGAVNISLAAITDKFDNLVSDMSLVTIDWLDNSGVKGSEQIQLSKGQAAYTSSCPANFSGALRVRAAFKNVENISSDVSNICSDSEG